MTIMLIVVALAVALSIFKVVNERKTAAKKRLYYITKFGGYPARSHSGTQKEYLKSELLRIASGAVNEVFVVDDQTWSDLDMDELFSRMDCCRTTYGSETLYLMLRQIRFDEDILCRRDEIVSCLSEEAELRTDIQILLDCMSMRRFESLYAKLDFLKKPGKSYALWDILCLGTGIVSTVLIFAKPAVGFFVFLAVLFINTISYLNERRSLAVSVSGYAEAVRLIFSGHKFGKKSSELNSDCAELNGLLKGIAEGAKALLPITRGSFLLSKGRNATGGLADLVLDYLRMFLHVDFILLYYMKRHISAKSDEIMALSDKIGLLDAYIAVASYRKMLEGRAGFCRPDFSKTGIEMIGLYHPLVKDCVDNDVRIDGCMLVTGSNASGKSTFLRSTALAVLLAQTIYTVPAKSYAASCYAVASSLGISDNILSGDSYYLSEIKSIKRIFDYSNQGKPLFCVIDEVLKGTNTAERVSASAEILFSLAQKSICIAATHDMELTDILANKYENYYFSEIIDENDNIVFPYTLKKGVSSSRNAIALLRMMGYPSYITERADERCKNYLRRGMSDLL